MAFGKLLQLLTSTGGSGFGFRAVRWDSGQKSHPLDDMPDLLNNTDIVLPNDGPNTTGFDLSEFHPYPSELGLGRRDLLPEPLPDVALTVLTVCYIVIIILSILGNGLVILVVVRNPKMRTVTNTFLVSLAVSDGLITIINMPIQLKFLIEIEWTMGLFLCKFANYMQAVVIVASITTLTGIAIERYYAICYPIQARFLHTTRRTAFLITAFWVMSFLLVSPQLVIQRLEPRIIYRDGLYSDRVPDICTEYYNDAYSLDISYTLFFYFILYLMPVGVMFATYGRIACKLWSRHPIGDTLNDSSDNDRRYQEKKRIVRMLMVIVILFVVSWFGFFTSNVYRLFNYTEHEHTSRIVIAILQLIGYSNSCVNPVIYCFLNESFRQHFLKTVCGVKYLWKKVEKRRRRSSTTTFVTGGDRYMAAATSETHNSVV